MHRLRLLFHVVVALLIVTYGALAGSQPQPAAGQLAANPVASRNVVNLPALANILDYGGYADAIRGGTHYVAAGNKVGIGAEQYLTVVMNSAGGNIVTVSPASALPDISAMPSAFYIIDVPGAGPAGAAAHGTVTSINTTTGVVTMTGGTFAPLTNFTGTIQLYQNGYPRQNTINGAFYGPVSVSNAVDATTGVVYGSTVVMGTSMIPYCCGSLGSDGIQLCIDTAGQNGWCGVVINDSAGDGKTLVVAGTGNSPKAIPYNQTTTSSKLNWGPFLFRYDDATACRGTGRYVEIPQAGSGIAPFGGQSAPYIGQITNRWDAHSATLSTNVGTTVAVGNTGVEGYLVSGCDDWPAEQNAARAVYRTPALHTQPVMLYFPSDSFMATAFNGSPDASQLMIQCGNGTVFWPQNTGYFHGAASCDRPRISSFPDTKDIIPAVHLKHLSSLAAGSTATIVFAGNSPGTPGYSGANFISSRIERICAAAQQAYPDLTIKCIDRGHGGTRMASLDPGGYTNGIALGSAPEPWYTDQSVPWLTGTIQAENPDVIVLGFSDQEATQAELSALINVQATTQGAAWLAATGRNPDLELIIWPWQTGAYMQTAMNQASSLYRSYAKACVSKLANGGCIGLIDEARMLSILVDGIDPETLPLQRAQALPSMNVFMGLTPTGWSYQTPRPGMSIPLTIRWDNAAPSTGGAMAAAGGEIDFTISGNVNANPQQQIWGTAATADAAAGQPVIAVGINSYKLFVGYGVSGASGLPANAVIMSVNNTAGTITLNNNLGAMITSGTNLTLKAPGPNTGYPGGLLRISKDNASGNLAYRYDTVYFQVAGADCSGTAGASVMTCSTPEIGHWHRGMQIAVPGAGSGQCPNPGGAVNCFVATIGNLSYSVNASGITQQTINLLAGTAAAAATNQTVATIQNTFSAKQPYVFRSSVPLTVSAAAAETLTGATGPYVACGLTAGVRVYDWFLIEYRGSRASAAFCYADGPGKNWFFDQYIERFDSPFLFNVNTPNNFASNTNFWLQFASSAYAYNQANTFIIGGGTFEVAPEYPAFRASARIGPDIYGYCTSYPFGDTGVSPNGGTCMGHYGHNGANIIDDSILSNLRLR